MVYEYGEPRWNDSDRKTKELGENPVTMFNTNPTWTNLGVNLGLCNHRPANNA
jgi:hypothetical protein